jgi:prepilin-type N-terminal cleavage/methylation domain-containing protein
MTHVEIESTEEPADRGMTLIEVLVAMALFAVLGSLLLGLALSTSAATQSTRNSTTVTEEARAALERMSRELRQSRGIDEVELPEDPANDPISFTFWTDFDGDGFRTGSASDPEVMKYTWNPITHRLYLSAPTVSPDALPVLAAKVTSFDLELRSSEWQYDTNGDGVTTWQELDAAGSPSGTCHGVPAVDPVGNCNDEPDQELASVDFVSMTLVVRDGNGGQTYTAQVDLRNRS